jgi:hypothetical protein
LNGINCSRAINRSNCFHRNGHDAPCEANNTVDMIIIFAGIQILLSQLPNFHKLWWLSIVAAVMSLAYSSIGLYDPFWLVDVGNACIAVHLIGAYQVFCQPVYQVVEGWARGAWPDDRGGFLNACLCSAARSA